MPLGQKNFSAPSGSTPPGRGWNPAFPQRQPLPRQNIPGSPGHSPPGRHSPKQTARQAEESLPGPRRRKGPSPCPSAPAQCAGPAWAPTPLALVNRLASPAAAAMATSSGVSWERMASPTFGPTPLMEVSSLKQESSPLVAKPNRSRASSRTFQISVQGGLLRKPWQGAQSVHGSHALEGHASHIHHSGPRLCVDQSTCYRINHGIVPFPKGQPGLPVQNAVPATVLRSWEAAFQNWLGPSNHLLRLVVPPEQPSPQRGTCCLPMTDGQRQRIGRVVRLGHLGQT